MVTPPRIHAKCPFVGDSTKRKTQTVKKKELRRKDLQNGVDHMVIWKTPHKNLDYYGTLKTGPSPRFLQSTNG